MRGGEITEEGEEEKDRGEGGPSICPGPKWGPTVPPDGPSVLSHALLSAPSSGTFPEKAPCCTCCQRTGILSSLTLNLLTYKMGWSSRRLPPRVCSGIRGSACPWVFNCGLWASSTRTI